MRHLPVILLITSMLSVANGQNIVQYHATSFGTSNVRLAGPNSAGTANYPLVTDGLNPGSFSFSPPTLNNATITGTIGLGGTNYTWPADANGFMYSDGAGNISWMAAAGVGDVAGPASAVDNNVTVFDGTTGKLIKDSGLLYTSIVSGPASAVDNNLASFDSTTGKLVKDSSILSTNVVTTTDTMVDNQVLVATGSKTVEGDVDFTWDQTFGGEFRCAGGPINYVGTWTNTANVVGCDGMLIHVRNDSASTDAFSVTSGAGFSRRLEINGNGTCGVNDATPDATWDITPAATNIVGLEVTGLISQSADLVSINTSATEVFKIAATGDVTITGDTGIGIAPTFPLQVYKNAISYAAYIQNDLASAGADGLLVTVDSASASTDALSINFGLSTRIFEVQGDGTIGINNASAIAALDIITNAIDDVGLKITAKAGQTADLVSVIDGSSNEVFSVEDDGTTIVENKLGTPNDPYTLGASVTTFITTSNVMTVTGNTSNAVATITGAIDGQILTLIHTDNLITYTDTETAAANTINLAGVTTNWNPNADDVLQIIFDGTSWFEVSRSVN